MTLQVFAHRGYWRHYPENTLSAFRAAAQLGAHGIELDLRLTRDGHAVVLHDETVDRTTNGAGPVEALSWAELCNLDAGAGERIPSLGAIWPDLDKSLRINIHLKATQDRRLPSSLVAAIGSSAEQSNSYLSMDSTTWLAMRNVLPGFNGCHLGPHPRNTSEFLQETHALGCRIIQLDWRIIASSFVDQAHDLGIEIHAMHLEANHDQSAYAAIPATGVDAVLTDFPDHWLE